MFHAISLLVLAVLTLADQELAHLNCGSAVSPEVVDNSAKGAPEACDAQDTGDANCMLMMGIRVTQAKAASGMSANASAGKMTGIGLGLEHAQVQNYMINDVNETHQDQRIQKHLPRPFSSLIHRQKPGKIRSKKVPVHAFQVPAQDDISLEAVVMWLIILSLLILWDPIRTAVTQIAVRLQSRFNGMDTPSGLCQQGLLDDAARECEGVLEPKIAAPDMKASATLCEVLLVGASTAERNSHSAIIGITSTRTWSLTQVTNLMSNPKWAYIADQTCVVLSMPPGPDMAVALLCTLARTRCAPMDPNFARDEARAFLQQVGATAAMSGKNCPAGIDAAAADLRLPMIELDYSLVPGVIHSRGVGLQPKGLRGCDMNTAADVALTLCTSGTTGRSKVVPLRLGQLVQGAQCIALTLDLKESDVCLNAMPLFHIGGISCNLLGSLVSGGAVICFQTSFNAETFATCLSTVQPAPTWYYAVPAMHSAVLALCEDSNRDSASIKHSLRFCRNAGAALPPSLQKRLSDFWDCQVFATYGSTECMPIASPLANDPLQTDGKWSAPLGSVGRSVGPVVEIHCGQVMVRGGLVMRGYEGSESGWVKDLNLFPTGDLGHVNKDGFLWITGRCKEAINRGGETIAPLQVEETLAKHIEIQEMAVFGIPHRKLGETVALAVVLKNPKQTKFHSLAEKFCQDVTHPPALLVVLDQLPRTSTGKIQRNAIYPALRKGGGPTELTGSEAGCVILDARGGHKGALTCRYLVAECGTVHAAFQEKSDRGEVEFRRDSLGILRQHSLRNALEAQTIMQVFFLHVFALNMNHFNLFSAVHCDQASFGAAACNPFYRLSVPVQQALLTFHASSPSAHMSAFFALTAYQDARNPYGRALNIRDALMLTIVIMLSCTQFLPDWPLLHTHPARWFFHCLLSARVFVAYCNSLRLPRIGQTLLAYPCAMLWAACLCCTSLGIAAYFGPALGQKVGVFVTCLSDPHEIPKYTQCIITYVICFSWLPSLVDYFGQRAPLTKSRQQLYGVLFWAMFVGFTVFDKKILMHYGQGWNVYGKCLSRSFADEFCLQAPVLWKYPFAFARVFLLVAAVAFLPLTGVPQFAYRSLLGALLAMPLTLAPMVSNAWLKLFSVIQRPVLQFLAVLLFYTMYFCAVGVLFQKGYELAQRHVVKLLHFLSAMLDKRSGTQRKLKLQGFEATPIAK